MDSTPIKVLTWKDVEPHCCAVKRTVIEADQSMQVKRSGFFCTNVEASMVECDCWKDALFHKFTVQYLPPEALEKEQSIPVRYEPITSNYWKTGVNGVCMGTCEWAIVEIF